MAEIDFITAVHTATKRNYLERVVDHDKAACAEVARRFGEEYWDGDRKYGYGGFRYDGRWRPVAERMARHYGLKPGMRVLDVGCGKGFLLYDLTQAVPGLEVAGVDVSEYARRTAKEEIRDRIRIAPAQALPFPDKHFDLVLSINTLHNLYVFDLKAAIGEIGRVSRGDAYIVVESYRTEREKANLLYWQLTCEAFFTPEEWRWLLREWGYKGDHGFIYFT